MLQMEVSAPKRKFNFSVGEILEHVPAGFQLRPNQVKILMELERNWARHDVFLVKAPVASGKSLILQTLTRWLNASGIRAVTLTPQVLLQDQYEQSFPDVTNIKGATRYDCRESKNLSCASRKDIFGVCCGGCEYTRVTEEAQSSSNVIANYHSYLAHRIHKEVLLLDESHNTFRVLQDLLTVNFWADKHKFPKETPTYGDISIWLEKLIKEEEINVAAESDRVRKMKKILESTNASPNHRQQAIDAIAESGSALTKAKRALLRYEMCYEAVTQCPEPMFIERGLETRHGKEIECIKIRPKNMTGLPRLLWPDKVQKIVFTSGTLHSLDIEKLGLSDKRVFEVEVDSIIPKANRPIIPITNVNLASKYQDKNLGKLVETLRMLMDEHPDTKGVIHTTYSLAAKLWPLLQDPRVMYHSGDDKQARLKEYIESTEPKVLVACGMSEGLDLNGHGYAWQAITKIMWPNRGDKLIDELYTSEPDYILWETIKTVIQQAGRICRGPEDQGATYIIDSGFGNVLTRQSGLIQRANRFIPNYFMESLQWQKGLELARRVR